MPSRTQLLLAAFCIGTLLPLSAQPAGSIRGLVVDENGKALAGVRWRICATEELRGGKWTFVRRSGLPPSSTTDDEGHFVVTFREPLRYDLQFQKSGFAPAFLYEVGTNSSELKVTLRLGQILHGTVTRRVDGNRKPMANQKVELRLPCRDFWYQDHATTDQDGKFEFRVCTPPSEPRTRIGNILAGSGEPPRSKWQVVVAGKAVQVDVTDDEAIKPADFEIQAEQK